MRGERSRPERSVARSGPDGRQSPSDGGETNQRRNENAAVRESGTVRTNGVETYYVRRGDGPPVIFIHSMAMSTAEWEPQMEALGNAYATVAYDVRGHGRTGGSDVGSYTMELYAADLDELLTALDVEEPVLCGLSMGGCIAQAYAAGSPRTSPASCCPIRSPRRRFP